MIGDQGLKSLELRIPFFRQVNAIRAAIARILAARQALSGLPEVYGESGGRF